MVAAEKSGYTGTYLIPPGGNYVAESLALLGIPPERTVRYTASAVRCERLIVPDALPGTSMAHYPQLFLALREQMLAACDAASGPLRRIYISRNSNPSLPRRLKNESALLALIKPYQFDCVSLEHFSLREQLSLMSHAEAIIAPHGAGMLHTLFTQKQAVVIELFPPDYINPCMLPIIKLLEHKYYMVPSYKNFADETSPSGEFYAFLEPVELALRREFKS